MRRLHFDYYDGQQSTGSVGGLKGADGALDYAEFTKFARQVRSPPHKDRAFPCPSWWFRCIEQCLS